MKASISRDRRPTWPSEPSGWCATGRRGSWTCCVARATRKQTSAKVLSYGVNGVALVLMVGVFAQTGGLTGAEVAIAGGSSAVGQKLVEALLGDQAVRQLTAVARSDLERRVDALIDVEAARFDAALARHRPSDHAGRLRGLADRLRKGVAT